MCNDWHMSYGVGLGIRWELNRDYALPWTSWQKQSNTQTPSCSSITV